MSTILDIRCFEPADMACLMQLPSPRSTCAAPPRGLGGRGEAQEGLNLMNPRVPQIHKCSGPHTNTMHRPACAKVLVHSGPCTHTFTHRAVQCPIPMLHIRRRSQETPTMLKAASIQAREHTTAGALTEAMCIRVKCGWVTRGQMQGDALSRCTRRALAHSSAC